jgi:hypothetical protein
VDARAGSLASPVVSDLDRELEAMRADVRKKLSDEPPPAIIEKPPVVAPRVEDQDEADEDDEDQPPLTATQAFTRKVALGAVALVALYLVWAFALGPLVKLGLTLAIAVVAAFFLYRLLGGGRRGKDDDD